MTEADAPIQYSDQLSRWDYRFEGIFLGLPIGLLLSWGIGTWPAFAVSAGLLLGIAFAQWAGPSR